LFRTGRRKDGTVRPKKRQEPAAKNNTPRKMGRREGFGFGKTSGEKTLFDGAGGEGRGKLARKVRGNIIEEAFEDGKKS